MKETVKRYRLGDVEEAVCEMDLSEVADDVAEIDEDMQLVVSGWQVFVEDLGLTLREGVVCVWDKEEGMYMPDFSVTVIYEGRQEPEDYLYYEQDGFAITLANWLNGRLPLEQIEQLWCELVIPEETQHTEKEQ